MIQPFIDLAGRNPYVERKANISAIKRAQILLEEQIKGIMAFDVAIFGPVTMDLTLTRLLSIPHNLRYKPVHLAYVYNASSNWYVPMPVIDFGSPAGGALETRTPVSLVSAYVDDTNLYLQWQGSSQIPQQQLYYFIFNKPIE